MPPQATTFREIAHYLVPTVVPIDVAQIFRCSHHSHDSLKQLPIGNTSDTRRYAMKPD
jgi:hypothetical protein